MEIYEFGLVRKAGRVFLEKKDESIFNKNPLEDGIQLVAFLHKFKGLSGKAFDYICGGRK